MSDSFTRFQEAYTASDQATKDLIDSEQIGLFAESLLSEPTNYSQKQQIIVAISNRILDISTDSEMVDVLEKTGLTTEVISKAKTFVDQQVASVPATPASPPTSSVEADLAEIEKSLHQISPVRTMASDGKQIGYSSTTEDTYSSSQSNIIDK